MLALADIFEVETLLEYLFGGELIDILRVDSSQHGNSFDKVFHLDFLDDFLHIVAQLLKFFVLLLSL